MAKKKRRYTFRKGRIIPVESGSLVHQIEREQRESQRRLQKALGMKKKPKSRRK